MRNGYPLPSPEESDSLPSTNTRCWTDGSYQHTTPGNTDETLCARIATGVDFKILYHYGKIDTYITD
jgi:hypothetical protein